MLEIALASSKVLASASKLQKSVQLRAYVRYCTDCRGLDTSAAPRTLPATPADASQHTTAALQVALCDAQRTPPLR